MKNSPSCIWHSDSNSRPLGHASSSHLHLTRDWGPVQTGCVKLSGLGCFGSGRLKCIDLENSISQCVLRRSEHSLRLIHTSCIWRMLKADSHELHLTHAAAAEGCIAAAEIWNFLIFHMYPPAAAAAAHVKRSLSEHSEIVTINYLQQRLPSVVNRKSQTADGLHPS